MSPVCSVPSVMSRNGEIFDNEPLSSLTLPNRNSEMHEAYTKCLIYLVNQNIKINKILYIDK